MIRLRDIAYRYPACDEEVLRSLSLDIGPGKVVLVSGPTGSGKSTLAHILIGAIPNILMGRLGGEARVLGIEPAKEPMRKTTAHAGLLMQNVEHQVFTDKVFDEIAFGLENHAVPLEEFGGRIRESLERVGAAHLEERDMNTLSSGERQKVMIASLLCLGQKLLILDEPLAYLDRQGVAELLSLARALADAGKTVIIVEHRRDLVLPAADMEIHLRGGRLADPAEALEAFPCMNIARQPGRPVLEVEDLALGYGERTLFSDLSFAAREGQSLVLLGDNGTGKTTLFKAIMGLVKPLGGKIENCGSDAAKNPTRKLADSAALVLQDPDRQLRLPTVLEEVAWSAAPKEAEEEMEALNILSLQERHPHSLSTGQKRRVTLASALAGKPRLLLMDEPTIGQDDASLELIFNRLEKYVSEGGSLIAATHDPRAAGCMAQKVLMLGEGGPSMGGPEAVADFFEKSRRAAMPGGGRPSRVASLTKAV